MLADFRGRLKFNQVQQVIHSCLLKGRYPSRLGQIADLVEMKQLELEDTVCRRQALTFELQEDGNQLLLHFHDQAINLPIITAKPLRFICEVSNFAIKDLPDLDDASKMVLLHRLIKEGFLTIMLEE